MEIGLAFVDTVYHKGVTRKNHLKMSRKPVAGCVDFCRKAKGQHHEIVVYFEISELKIHPSFVRRYLHLYHIPFDRIYQVSPCNMEECFDFLDMLIRPGEISCDGFYISCQGKDIYRCATDMVSSSAGEWTDEQVVWFNALFAAELRVTMDDQPQ